MYIHICIYIERAAIKRQLIRSIGRAEESITDEFRRAGFRAESVNYTATAQLFFTRAAALGYVYRRYSDRAAFEKINGPSRGLYIPEKARAVSSVLCIYFRKFLPIEKTESSQALHTTISIPIAKSRALFLFRPKGRAKPIFRSSLSLSLSTRVICGSCCTLCWLSG